jgi:hypothetical protein
MKKLTSIEDIVSSLEVVKEIRQTDCQAITVVRLKIEYSVRIRGYVEFSLSSFTHQNVSELLNQSYEVFYSRDSINNTLFQQQAVPHFPQHPESKSQLTSSRQVSPPL